MLLSGSSVKEEFIKIISVQGGQRMTGSSWVRVERTGKGD